MTTPQDIITEARYVLNDTDSTSYRNTNTELLGWVNDALAAAVNVRPDFFITTANHTCTTGVEQAPTLTRLVRVLGVNRVVGGNVVTICDKNTLDAYLPGWRAMSAAAAVHWMPHTDPKRFDLYPPSDNAQVVEVKSVQAPATLALGDTIPIPDNCRPALVNYVIGMAEFKDDEHTLSERSAQAKAAFAEQIKGV